jgi:hypothetical protein
MATYYVSNSATNGYAVGSDSNTLTQALSKSTPFLTISKFVASAATGDTCVINNGTYSESTAGVGYLNIAVSKSYTFLPETSGQVIIKPATSTTRAVHLNISTGKTITFGAVVIDGNNTATSGVTYTTNATLFYVSFTGTTFQNCSVGLTVSAAKVNLSIINCIFNTNNVIFSSNGVMTDSSLLIQGCTASIPSSIGTSAIKVLGASASGNSVTIKNNNITWGYTGASATPVIGIYVANINDAVIDNNTLNITSAVSVYGIQNEVTNVSYTAHRAIIKNNIINSTSSDGVLILNGTDGSTSFNNLFNYPQIYNNVTTVIGAVGHHGIMLGSCTGGIVYGNTVTGAALNFLAKLTTEGIFTGNVSKGTLAGCHLYRAKGAVGTMFVNNTGIISSSTSVGFYASVDDVTGIFSNVKCYNNVFYLTNSGAYFITSITGNTVDFKTNAYYSTIALSTGQWNYGGSAYSTFAAWQAIEATAIYVDPLFKDTSIDYKILPTSTLYRVGTYFPKAKDFRGRPFWAKPTIGAYEFTGGDLVQTRSTASTRSSATTRTTRV